MPTLTLSEALSSDLDEIAAFIEREKSSYIIAHSLPEQRSAIDQGMYFKIKAEDGEIAGVGSVIVGVAVTRKADGTLETYHELANTLIAKNWRGFGLQYELILVRTATTVTVSPPPNLLSAINPKNSGSLHNVVTKAGFKPCVDFLPELKWGCGECPQRPDALSKGRECCCDCFVLQLDQCRVLIREFLDRGQRTIRHRREGGQTVALEFDCAVTKNERRRRILHNFVNGAEWM